MKVCLLLGSASAALMIAGAAQAQVAQPVANEPSASTSGDAPAVPDAAAAQNSGVADIVVTAQRRSENLQRAAIPISAVSADTLKSANVTQPDQLSTLVPALQTSSGNGGVTVFYLRGVGNLQGTALSDSAVAFNFNGVYIARAPGNAGFFYDLDRVEVVKGPQGTLYGRNATGGSINVLPHRPDLNEFSAALSTSYGNYNASISDASVNVPISSIAAVRVAGMYARHDGYMQDGTDTQRDAGGRISLRVEPSDSLSINIVGDYSQQHGTGAGGTPIEAGIDDRPGYASTEGIAFVTSRFNTLYGRNQAPLLTKPFIRNYNWGIAGTIDLKTPIGTFTVVPAYRKTRTKNLSSFSGFYVGQDEKDRQSTVEARLASDDSKPLRYLAGVYYYNETNSIPQQIVNQVSSKNIQEFHQTINSMATFGRLTYAILPSVRFNVGARYTTEDRRFDGVLQGRDRVCILPTGCPAAVPFDLSPSLPPPSFIPDATGTITTVKLIDNTGAAAKKQSVERVTYRAGVDWDITNRNLLFANFETGFKSGGFFFSSDAGTFQPETIKAYTIGSKNRFFGNRLQINIEGFLWKYRNQQITSVVVDSKNIVTFATQNVGKASFKGVEVDLQFRPLANTLLGGDVQYLDAKYDSFVYTSPNFNGGVNNGTGCPSTGITAGNYVVNCSGLRPPNAPKWTINVNASQTFPLSNGSKFVLSGRAHYQTRTLTGLQFTVPQYQGKYWLADADLTYFFAGQRFSISGFVNNMFDKTVLALSIPVPFSDYNSGSLRPPRTFGVRASARF